LETQVIGPETTGSPQLVTVDYKSFPKQPTFHDLNVSQWNAGSKSYSKLIKILSISKIKNKSIYQLLNNISNLGVNNLSSHFIPTWPQLSVLSKGLKFIPTPRYSDIQKLSRVSLLSSFASLRRSLRLKFMFAAKDNAPRPIDPFYVKSNFEPEIQSKAIEIKASKGYTYLTNAINKGIRRQRLIHPNLNSEELKAITQLNNNKEIIIKPADKNLGLTILDRSWYLQECLSQLNDPKVYKSHSPPDFAVLQSTVIDFAKALPANESKFVLHQLDLRIKKQIIPEFYIIPKIHKPKLAGRPIVANHSFCLNQISRWVDIKLQPVVKCCSTILSNSDTLRKELDAANRSYSLNKYYSFITADVTSLYPNIPIDIGVNLVGQVLSQVSIYDNETNSTILRGLKLVLDNSYLHFNGVVYHQIQGTAMGAPLAPCYANIFLFSLEQKWLSDPAIAPHVTIFKRYIDDIFVFWFDSHPDASVRKSTLDNAIDMYNSYLPTIKITPDISTQSVNFLDLHLFKENFQCKYRTYKKTMNRFLYIPFSSYHSNSQKFAFIKTELIRLVRNSSSESYFVEDAKFFKQCLLQRGYGEFFLNLAFKQVSYALRAQYLQPKVKETHYKSDNFFVPLLRNPLLDKLPISRVIKSVIDPKLSLTIAKSNPPSIQSRLIRAKFK
jgi:hypothetical protein